MTNKQKAFCEEYVVNGCNGTQAYLFAYFGDLDPIERQTKYNTANDRAAKMLKLDYIRDYIKELQKEAFERAMITPEKVALELNRIAFDTDASYNDKLKALNLIQKQLGMITEQVKADVSGDVVIDVKVE